MSKLRICKAGCLWCAVLLAALGIVLQLPQQFYYPNEIVELPPNRREFGHELLDISPVALEFEACAGFAQQLIQLSKILILGFSLGAQVLLPMNSSNAWDVLEMQKLLDTSQFVFREAQCDKPPGPERSFWCREHHVTAILRVDASRQAFVRAGRRMMMIEHIENLAELHNQLWQSRQSIAYVTCPAVLNFTVVEPGERWDLFWKFLDNMEFWEDIVAAKSRIVQSISEFAAIAKKKSEPMGYATHGDKTVFNVLHLRAEPDWHQFCRFDFIPRGQNNCMNNTFEVANVLLSEGVNPSIPLYLATGFSNHQLEQWHSSSTVPSATDNLFNVYTLVTQNMLSEIIFQDWAPEGRRHKMFWPALSFLLGTAAKTFIGNSVSTFSGLLIQNRMRHDRGSIHYNGGGVHLQETHQLRPKRELAMPALRMPIKWVFCIRPKHGKNGQVDSSAFNMAKVAIRSALRKTKLVPVGVTTADPRSKFAADLVSMGVRLIYHLPSWANYVKSMIENWNNSAQRYAGNKKPSHLLSDVDAMVGTFLRIDVPIVGILDPLVFYADIDILFQRDVTWKNLLGPKYQKYRMFQKFKDGNNFAHQMQLFTKPGTEGFPQFFSMSAETERIKEAVNAGVMLINMVTMRDAYDSFLQFILSSGDITWEIGPGDQGALRTFFRDKDGRPLAAFLPFEFNWKAYWPKNSEAAVVHFHGPKCEADILPYLNHGLINFPLFEFLLKHCKKEGNCRELCEEYMSYLDA